VKLAEKKKKTELPVSSLCPASLLTERRNKDRKRKATFSLHNPREDSKKRKKRKLRKRTTTRRRKEHKRRKTQHRPKHTPKKKGNERWGEKREKPLFPTSHSQNQTLSIWCAFFLKYPKHSSSHHLSLSPPHSPYFQVPKKKKRKKKRVGQ